MTYQLHPLCTLFPRIEGAEFDALAADIQANGLREPIVLSDGMILDGGNRYRACIAADVEPRFTEFEGPSIVAFVLSANLHRRHMTPGQQAAIVASAQDWAKAQGRGGDRRSEEIKVSADTLKTAQARAATAGVSIATQKRADKVAKADPELSKQVARGETTLPAAVRQVEGKPAKPAAPAPAPARVTPATPADTTAEDAYGDTDLAELCAELQAEVERLQAQIKVLTADDTKAELHKMLLQRDHAVREQGVAMDRAHKSTEREKWTKRQLMRCGKAVGQDDPDRIAAAVEAFVREARKAA